MPIDQEQVKKQVDRPFVRLDLMEADLTLHMVREYMNRKGGEVGPETYSLYEKLKGFVYGEWNKS